MRYLHFNAIQVICYVNFFLLWTERPDITFNLLYYVYFTNLDTDRIGIVRLILGKNNPSLYDCQYCRVLQELQEKVYSCLVNDIQVHLPSGGGTGERVEPFRLTVAQDNEL